jgi:hypothetical protein
MPMNKIIMQLTLVVLVASVLTMGALSSTQLAYSKGDHKKVVHGGFAQAIVKTDGKKYNIDGRYDVAINDDNTLTITVNRDARDTNDIKLSTNDDLTIKFKCQEKDCDQTARHGQYKSINVYIVDKNEKNIDIAKKNIGDKIKTIANKKCSLEPLTDCKLKTTVPDDIKSGKYKLVINAAYDEGNVYYINLVKIKE